MSQNKYLLTLQKPLFQNFVSLGFLQVSNFIIPLVVFPFLVRTIGIEKFGLIAFAQAIVNYFVIFTDYGFNLSATREVSLNRGNSEKLQQIFNAVLSTKLFLGFICSSVFFIILLIFPQSKIQVYLYLFSFIVVLGQLFLPIWFFQGVEKMKYLLYSHVAGKVLFGVLILIFVSKPEHYIYVNLILGISYIVTTALSLFFIFRQFKIYFSLDLVNIKEELRKSWPLFVSNFSINVYMNSNLFVLGVFAGAETIGVYSIAEKIVMAVRQLLSVFSQVIYPHLCNLSLQGFESVKLFIRKMVVPFMVLIFVVSTLTFFMSDFITILLTGQFNREISLILKILAFVPFIVALNIPVYQVLLIQNLKTSYTAVLVSGSLLNIAANFCLAAAYQAPGTAFSVIFTEIFITFSLYWVLESKFPQFSIFHFHK